MKLNFEDMTLDNETSRNHAAQILAFLKDGNSITRADSIQLFGCINLPGRIWDLRKDGIEIVSERRKFVNRNGHKGSVCLYHLKNA